MFLLEVRMKNILQVMRFQKRCRRNVLFHVVPYGYRRSKQQRYRLQHRTDVNENYTLTSKMGSTPGLSVDYTLLFGKHNCIAFECFLQKH